MNSSIQPQPPPVSPTPPRSIQRGSGLRIVGILLGLVLLGGSAVLFFFDPAHNGFYPRCQLFRMTGLQCPGCGGLRALHALLHGNVIVAFRLNPLFVLALPAAAAWIGDWLVRKQRNPTARLTLPTMWIWMGLAVIIVFGVARNLPGLAGMGSGL